MLAQPVTPPVSVSRLDAPHFAVVMSPVPSNGVPFTLRAVCSLVAVAALPLTPMPHVPLAPPPVLVGASVMPYPDSVVGFDVSEANVCAWLEGLNVDGLPVTSSQDGQRVTYAGGAEEKRPPHAAYTPDFSTACQEECRSLTFSSPAACRHAVHCPAGTGRFGALTLYER